MTAEVCPHHISLTEDAVEGYDTNAKMNPPLRTADDVAALQEAVRDGTIDLIATDHAPHHYDEKEREFADAPNGIIGLETALAVNITWLVASGIIDLPLLIERMSCAPARVFKLPGGSLRRGTAADVTVFDPNAQVARRAVEVPVEGTQHAVRRANAPGANALHDRWRTRGASRRGVSEADDRRNGGAAIVRVCRRLYERGLVAGPDGNVSVRLSDGSILVTPAGCPRSTSTPDDLVVVDLEGRVARRTRSSIERARVASAGIQPSGDVRAVVHAHPPIATGFSVAGESFVAPVLPEVILQMGAVPLVPYVTPGTDALADSCEPYLDRYDAFLLANHGATTLGATLDVAHQRMESLEHAAKILLAARTLGRVNELSASDVAALRRPREESR